MASKSQKAMRSLAATILASRMGNGVVAEVGAADAIAAKNAARIRLEANARKPASGIAALDLPTRNRRICRMMIIWPRSPMALQNLRMRSTAKLPRATFRIGPKLWDLSSIKTWNRAADLVAPVDKAGADGRAAEAAGKAMADREIATPDAEANTPATGRGVPAKGRPKARGKRRLRSNPGRASRSNVSRRNASQHLATSRCLMNRANLAAMRISRARVSSLPDPSEPMSPAEPHGNPVRAMSKSKSPQKNPDAIRSLLAAKQRPISRELRGVSRIAGDCLRLATW